MLNSIINQLKNKGLKGSFLEEMTDHFACDFEQELAKGNSEKKAAQLITARIEQQNLKPVQKKIFIIHHRNKILFMNFILALIISSFFLFSFSPKKNLTNSPPEILTAVDSLIFGKVVEGDVKITANFGKHFHPFKGQRVMHKGLDIRGNIGDAVFAPLNGIVEKIGEDSARGKYIELSHPEGYTTRYFHLSKILVTVNQTVEQGIEIGKIGNTGMSTGPHLHVEILKNETLVDPEDYLKV